LGAVGFEHLAEMAEKQGIPAERGTESGTLGDDPASNRQAADVPAQAFPADLADVVNAWPDLPATIKAGILAMVKAAKG
jgi:hypothetical protein